MHRSAALTEQEVRDETDRVLKALEWSRSPEGIDYHVNNVGTSHRYGVVAGMLEDLVNYGKDTGLNPAYLLGYCALRIYGQSEDDVRDDLEKLIPSWDGLDGIYLNDEDRQLREAAKQWREGAKKAAATRASNRKAP